MTLCAGGIEKARDLFGPAPILTSEDPERFETLFVRVATSIKPQDFTELLLIWQFVCESWNINRYTRHATVAIERRHREHLVFLEQRAHVEERRKQSRAGTTFANADPKDIAALADLEEKFLSVDEEVGEILDRNASERDHNSALQRSIIFQEQLDKLINSATRRRDDALHELELYRSGVGAKAKELVQRIIEGEFAESTPLSSDAPALAAPVAVEIDERE